MQCGLTGESTLSSLFTKIASIPDLVLSKPLFGCNEVAQLDIANRICMRQYSHIEQEVQQKPKASEEGEPVLSSSDDRGPVWFVFGRGKQDFLLLSLGFRTLD